MALLMTRQIRDRITEIKRKNPRGKNYTNFFVQEQEQYDVLAGDNSVVLSHTGHDGVRRVYFYSSDLGELGKLLGQTAPGSILDYLGDCGGALQDALRRGGYGRYTRFLRLSNRNFQHIFDSRYNPYADYLCRFPAGTGVEFASAGDLDPLIARLNDVFDYNTSHFASREKLGESIRDREVLVYKPEGELVSFLVFSITGKKFYVAHTYNQAAAYIAISMYVKAARIALGAGCTYGYSWVEETNEASLRFNRLKQYLPDGFTDTIFRKGE